MRCSVIALLFVFSLLLSAPTFAAVTIDAPKTVKLLVINGKKIPARQQQAEAADGLCQLVFRVDTEFRGKTLLDGERVQSDVFILRFEAADDTVSLKIPEFKKKSQLVEFNKNPQIQLVSSSGSDIPYVFDRLKKEGLQIGRDFYTEVALYNQTDAPAAIRTGGMMPLRVTAKIPQQKASAPAASTPQLESDQSVPESMLKYWYQQADEETRRKFMQWVSEQPM